MRLVDEFRTTTNSRYYKLLLRRLREQRGELWCSWCGYHQGCNRTHDKRFIKKNWKEYRKQQYRNVVVHLGT